jgi:hypothetical protein
MNNLDNSDLQNYCSQQNRRSFPPATTKEKQLAAELLDLVNHNPSKAQDILRKIFFDHPNKSIEWYYEQAIKQCLF